MAVHILVRCVGHKSITLRPGDTLRVGRHHSNDLVLADGTVSRFHAEIQWDKDEDRPWIVDKDSANGVELDDDFVEERAPLAGNNQIGIGDFTLVLQLKGLNTSGAVTQEQLAAKAAAKDNVALIDDGEATSIRLFSESLKKIKGKFADADRLQRLFLHLEEKKRTGTLVVTEGTQRQSKVMFGQGKIITANRGVVVGLTALSQILDVERGSFEFTADIEPSEENLDLSVKSFLERGLDETARGR